MSLIPAERLKNISKSAIRRVYDSALPDSIKLWLGELDIRRPPVVRHEAVRGIEEEDNGYTPNAGLLSLRERIVGYHGKNSVLRFRPESVCVTNGAEEALFAVTMALAGPGDEIALPDPGFLAYPALAQIAGANIKTYELAASRRFAFDRESFDRAITD